MIQRVLPYEGLLHEVVEHNGVLYIGGIVPEDTSLDMSGQANDVLGQLDPNAYDTARIKPQMMYGYAKAGRINGVKGNKEYTDAEVSTFVARFIATRKIAK